MFIILRRRTALLSVTYVLERKECLNKEQQGILKAKLQEHLKRVE